MYSSSTSKHYIVILYYIQIIAAEEHLIWHTLRLYDSFSIVFLTWSYGSSGSSNEKIEVHLLLALKFSPSSPLSIPFVASFILALRLHLSTGCPWARLQPSRSSSRTFISTLARWGYWSYMCCLCSRLWPIRDNIFCSCLIKAAPFGAGRGRRCSKNLDNLLFVSSEGGWGGKMSRLPETVFCSTGYTLVSLKRDQSPDGWERRSHVVLRCQCHSISLEQTT